MKRLLAILLLCWVPAFGQVVQPQPGLQSVATVEIRLKGIATATNPSPTVRLLKWQPSTVDAKIFGYTITCWNTKSACPQVVSATVRVYLTLPWLPNVNVTKYVLCDGTECRLPAFSPLIAKPGEAYSFRYNRLTAQWEEPPKVILIP